MPPDESALTPSAAASRVRFSSSDDFATANRRWQEGLRIDGQMERLIAVLERIAEALEDQNERSGYTLALEKWKLGQGKHPDD